MILGIRPPSAGDGFVTVGIFLLKLVTTFVLSVMFAIGVAISNFIVLVKTMPTLLIWFGPVMHKIADHSLWIVPAITFIGSFVFLWRRLTQLPKIEKLPEK